MINRQIIISTVILIGAGVYRVLLIRPDPNAKHAVTITRVLVGGYMLAIIASVVDLVGGAAGAQVAGLLLALAVTAALFAILPDLLSRFSARKGA